jgi:hypothetical protein
LGKQSTLRSLVHPPQYRYGGRATEDGKAEIASRRAQRSATPSCPG